MMALTPEQFARQKIDGLLIAAGWVLQDMAEFNRNAALGVAVREFQLPSGPCDYLLFIGGQAAGVIEAKPAGVTLSGVAEQSDKYMGKLPSHLRSWGDTLLLDYESTGEETFFRFMRDPVPRSRRVFAFHKPETLRNWLEDTDTLRGRMTKMPPLVEAGLRDCQIEAIGGLEKSLAQDKPRSLIQMATGAGKTFTACTFSYRLIKHAKAKRVLFLVDRNNLGNQTLREFQNFDPPGEGHKFPNVYNVQHLHSNRIDKDAKVVITTIQRLFAMLQGEELDPDAEEISAFESDPTAEGAPREVAYNPQIPIEMFDVIITDECHRSIYGVWRQVLEYFDAHIIGLTATPSKHTLAYFGQNLVAEYPYERSVADGVNVAYEIFRIRTQVSEQGGKVEGNFAVGVRDRRTRKLRYEQLDEDLDYQAKDVDRTVTVPNQIRLILETYKNVLSTELFPGREWVPKTLIFAKDDNHAEEIVHIAREVFTGGNDFAKKITYRTTGETPQELLKSFRVEPNPRIAVTVDMIATGTDVKAIEVLIFMRDVKSSLYFEQMKGRGARTIKDADLLAVTGDAKGKTKFILIDAVGVTESLKSVSRPLERKRGITFDKLLDRIAGGDRDEDSLSSLAGRLAALEHDIEDEDKAAIKLATGGAALRDLANRLLDAIDPDKVTEAAEKLHSPPVTDEQFDTVGEKMRDEACAPFDNPKVRQLLKDIRHKSQIVIDDKTQDGLVVPPEFATKQAEDTVAKFKDFIEKNKDELLALQILYSQPYKTRALTYAAIKDLTDAMTRSPWFLDTATVWQAYKRLEGDKVKGVPTDKLLTNIIALVRFATGQDATLESYSTQVVQRFNLWMGRQKKAGNDYTPEQTQWLELIRDHIAANAAIEPNDFQDIPNLSSRGGLIRARTVFGGDLGPLLDDMNKALVA
jgi:type I restriction enzyme R subunit